MREMNFLHYRPSGSFWHRHDPRFKFLELAVWSVLALAGGIPPLAATAGILVILHAASGSRLRYLYRPLLFWLAMALAITATSGLSLEGRQILFLQRELPLSREGLISGGIRAFRLLVMLLAGQLLVSTTDPADLADAVRRIAFFLPRKWASALGSAVSLTLAFLPLLLDEASVVRDAAFSRGLGSRRSLLRRAVSLGLPLTENTLRRADLTAEAMLSRAFSGEPAVMEMKIRPTDLGAFVFSTLLPLLTLLFPYPAPGI